MLSRNLSYLKRRQGKIIQGKSPRFNWEPLAAPGVQESNYWEEDLKKDMRLYTSFCADGMATTTIAGYEERRRSFELLAKAFAVTPRAGNNRS
jgi:hypothetical protein